MEFYYFNLSVVTEILLINLSFKKFRNLLVLKTYIEQLIERYFKTEKKQSFFKNIM